MDFMRKLLLLSLLIFSGCMTAPKQEEILLPQPEKNSVQISYIKEAAKTKLRIGEAGNNVFDFYYGPKGSYFIIISAIKQPYTFDLNDYDATLIVNGVNALTPEVLALSSEDPQVLSAFGSVREGVSLFELQLTPVDPSLARPLNFKFKVEVKSFL